MIFDWQKFISIKSLKLNCPSKYDIRGLRFSRLVHFQNSWQLMNEEVMRNKSDPVLTNQWNRRTFLSFLIFNELRHFQESFWFFNKRRKTWFTNDSTLVYEKCISGKNHFSHSWIRTEVSLSFFHVEIWKFDTLLKWNSRAISKQNVLFDQKLIKWRFL